ncbi:MAG: DUF427 domain-containing protein [Rickettsiales bacterium]|jgi:uncharacterized protein (DUF427 family)
MAENKAPGFRRKPDYPLTVAPVSKTVRVTFGGETVAESRSALVMHEADYGPVYYIPRADVRTDLLTRTDHSTHCPFKGDAAYWRLAAGGRTAENAVWSYETPFDEVAAIRGAMSFYPSKVDAIDVEDA